MKHTIRSAAAAASALLCSITPVSAVSVPATGDEGLSTILLLAGGGALLIAAFSVLTSIQKKRRQNRGDDD